MVSNPHNRMAIIRELASASGTAGMAGGQAIDLWVQGREPDVTTLENMHALKTGALINASVLMAAWSADDPDPTVLDALGRFGKAIGLAFQIQDDILDIEGDTETLGKTAGADSARDKPTYPSVAGLKQARRRAAELCDEAIRALPILGESAVPLRQMAAYIVRRDS